MRILGSCLLLAALSLPSQAGTIVTTDSGNIGEFRAVNMGINGSGQAMISFDVPSVSAQINTVNGVFVIPEPIAVNTPLTLLVTPTSPATYSLNLVPSTYTTTIGFTPGSEAVQSFTMDTGIAPILLPDFFNMSGRIVALLANSNPDFDFVQFASGVGTMNITLTATSFGGATNINTFAEFLSTPGAFAVGNGSFSQTAVSEPRAVALMGIGMSSIIAVRRFRRRRRDILP